MKDTADFLNSLCFGDKQSFSNVLTAYNNLDTEPYIEFVGYNSYSGAVCFYLENGISILEAFRGIQFLVDNRENGDEFFFDTYEKALAFKNKLDDGLSPENEEYQNLLN